MAVAASKSSGLPSQGSSCTCRRPESASSPVSGRPDAGAQGRIGGLRAKQKCRPVLDPITDRRASGGVERGVVRARSATGIEAGSEPASPPPSRLRSTGVPQQVAARRPRNVSSDCSRSGSPALRPCRRRRCRCFAGGINPGHRGLPIDRRRNLRSERKRSDNKAVRRGTQSGISTARGTVAAFHAEGLRADPSAVVVGRRAGAVATMVQVRAVPESLWIVTQQGQAAGRRGVFEGRGDLDGDAAARVGGDLRAPGRPVRGSCPPRAAGPPHRDGETKAGS